jgi:nucleoside-diphosphate-sugar epimerase
VVARGGATPRQILITGAAGLIGTVLMRGLDDRYAVRGVDRARRTPPNVGRLDLAQSRLKPGAFEGVDAIVDLAGLPDHETPWRDIWRNNLPATMNALEAARRAGIRRYVFASSNHVTGMYEHEQPWSAIVAGEYAGLDPARVPLIDRSWPIRPDGAYAVGKALGEAAARWYADAFGISAICLRIGTVNRHDRPLQPRHFATLLTHRDLLRLVAAALDAPETLRYGVYYGVSRNTWRFWELADAAAEIGFEPEDDAESFR